VCLGHAVSHPTLGPLGQPEKAIGHESQIELWSPLDRRSALLVSEFTGIVAKKAMKTAGRENPNHGVALPHDRAHDAEEQNRSRSIKWAAKQEQFQPQGDVFFLDFSLYRTFQELAPTKTLSSACRLREQRLRRYGFGACGFGAQGAAQYLSRKDNLSFYNRKANEEKTSRVNRHRPISLCLNKPQRRHVRTRREYGGYDSK
jgi:hypothetical protein